MINVNSQQNLPGTTNQQVSTPPSTSNQLAGSDGQQHVTVRIRLNA
jgi:heme-binding NEAT domain protein